MRTHVTYILIIAVLIGLLTMGWLTIRKQHRKISQGQENLSEQVRGNSELTRVLKITKDQYAQDYAAMKHVADSLKGRKGKVTEHTRLVYEYKVDTVLKVQYLDPIKYDNDWYAEFNSGCVTSMIHFVDSAGIVEINSTGEIPIDIVEYFSRKKYWFWRLQWGANGWEATTKVSTPCGLTIKENIKVEIQ